MPNIVNVVVSQQVASAPSTLQRTGAFVTQGGTTLTAGSTALLTQMSDLTAILSSPIATTSLVWNTGVVTVTLASPHGIPLTDTLLGIISGVTPTAYNGTFTITSTGTNTFTYALVSSPGTATVQGTYVTEAEQDLVAMATTYFAQGTGNAVYVLELGIGTAAQGVTALAAYMANPTIPFYSYCVTTEMSADSTMPALVSANSSPTSKVYFFISVQDITTPMNADSYGPYEGNKAAVIVYEDLYAPVTQWSAAAVMAQTLNYNPAANNLASPLEYTFVYGVIPPVLTNAQQTTLAAIGVNWIGTGAQGQISTSLIENGECMDLHPFNYWYSTDWVNINAAIALSAAIINGSNTPTNPLYYNQAGINSLQQVAQALMNNGISFGLILSPCTVNAISFVSYIAQHPSDYAAGIYNGLSVTFVPLRGFNSITIYLTASNIPV